MNCRAVDAQVYTWAAEDYAEYWKLYDLSLSGAYSGSNLFCFVLKFSLNIVVTIHFNFHYSSSFCFSLQTKSYPFQVKMMLKHLKFLRDVKIVTEYLPPYNSTDIIVISSFRAP